MQFRQLTSLDKDKVNHFHLAELTWKTDPYIYPAICSERDIDLIEALYMSGNDSMFHLNNCFVTEDSGGIVGLILWARGPLNWNSHQLRYVASKKGRTLSPLLPLTEESYFRSYRDVQDNVISLINVCVDERKQGAGIGTAMLREFMSSHQGETLELFCLADNLAAVRLYQRAGFEIMKAMPAFAPEAEKQILCYQMVRKNTTDAL